MRIAAEMELIKRKANVSIHTLHELEARFHSTLQQDCRTSRFPFIRFTNWKQEQPMRAVKFKKNLVSIHTLHELEASSEALELSNKESEGFHAYASRIGSKLMGFIPDGSRWQ